MNDMGIPIDDEKKWFTFYKIDGTKETLMMTHGQALAKYRDDRHQSIMFIDVNNDHRYSWNGVNWYPTDESDIYTTGLGG